MAPRESDVVSPTTVTNSLPRPKSPRTPRLSYSSSRFACEQQREASPSELKQCTDKNGENGQVDHSPKKSSPDHSFNHRSKALTSSRGQKLKRQQRSDVQDQYIRGCVHGGFEISRQISECFLITSDIYKQECTVTHKMRGDDRMFFVFRDDDQVETVFSDEYTISEENSVTVSPDKDFAEDQLLLRRSPSDEQDELKLPFHQNMRITRYPEPFRVREHKGGRQGISPVRKDHRRPRGSYEHIDQDPTDRSNPEVETRNALTQSSPPTPMQKQNDEHCDLREVRLALFRQDCKDEPDTSTGWYEDTVENVVKEDQAIQIFRSELADTKEKPENATTELASDLSHTTFREEVLKGQDISEEQKNIRENLRKQLLENQGLRGQVDSLQCEVDHLKSRLECSKSPNERETRLRTRSLSRDRDLDSELRKLYTNNDQAGTPTRSNGFRRNPPSLLDQVEEDDDNSTDGAQDDFVSSMMISLKAEIVGLKAQLAEAHALSLSVLHEKNEAKERCNEIEKEAYELRHQVTCLKSELEDIRKLNVKETQDNQEIRMLKDEIADMTSKLAEADRNLLVHTELKKKLQDELNGTQIEADNLRDHLSRFTEELEKTKKDTDEKIRASQEEMRLLQSELIKMKVELSKTNTEIIEQASNHIRERRRMGEELYQAKQAAEILQRKVISLDDQIASAEAESLCLREQLEEEEREHRNSTGSSISGFLQRNVADSNVLLETLRKRLEKPVAVPNKD